MWMTLRVPLLGIKPNPSIKVLSFSSKPCQLKQHRRMLKIITHTHTHTLLYTPILFNIFFFSSVSMCTGASVIMTLCINSDPTITTSPRHTLPHTHMPYHHTLPPHHGLRNICFLTPCRNLLTLSIIPATYKTLLYQVVSVCTFVPGKMKLYRAELNKYVCTF